MIKITSQTARALHNAVLQKNLRYILGKSEQQRDAAVAEVENWEELRSHARQVKLHTLARLPYYLQQLEASVKKLGGHVLWAETGEQALQLVTSIAAQKEARMIVKSKSMLSEELHLNEALRKAGIDIVETDLGEYIVQLSGETPSHIVGPALHKSKEEVAELFAQKLGMIMTQDVSALTATARSHLRHHFVNADLGISGVNFAVAETGTIVIVENEGNARLSVSLPRTHVALMGIEKVIPRATDLPVFLKLLVRSATGQRMTTYVNMVTGARRSSEADGPDEFYLVIVDNGRSQMLRDPHLRETLACIRCGACQNACPVFQTIGGHAYGTTYQGPIGAILTPQLIPLREVPEHPFSSSLCGKCKEVCPVKIEIPEILLRLRKEVVKEKRARTFLPSMESIAMRIWALTMASPRLYGVGSRLVRLFIRSLQHEGRLRPAVKPWSLWQADRNLPPIPSRSFRETFQNERSK